jgi:serine/threonine protein kinase
MLLLPKSREDFNEIYIVSELMETDLASIIKSPQPIIEEHIQIFLYQIIRGLKYLHTAGILHRDLKPRNL